MLAKIIQTIWIILHALTLLTQPRTLTWYLDDTIPDGFNTTLTIFVGTCRSHLHCAMECYNRGACMTMSYNPSSQRCRAYNQEILPNTPLTPMSTEIQFYKAYPCLRPDYTYESELDTCVKLHKLWLPHGTARTKCASEGGHLITVKQNATYSYMDQVIQETGIAELLVGAERSPTNVEEYNWATGDLITPDNGGQFWLPWEPKVNSNNCIAFWNASYGLGLRVLGCTKGRPFICQRVPRW